MKCNAFKRTPVLNFFDLTEEQQRDALNYDDSAEDSMYVLDPMRENEVLSLNNFMRTSKPNRFHGFFGTSCFDGYGVILAKHGENAIVCHLIW